MGRRRASKTTSLTIKTTADYGDTVHAKYNSEFVLRSPLEVELVQRSNPANVFSSYEMREELRRIVQSKLFAGSPKKIRFLEFIAEQTFQGKGEKLNEYLIGTEVYDRGPEFDQQKDPIVRVQAHEIRRLLKKYYEGESKSSVLRMELPTGGYVPVFTRSEPESGPELVIAALPAGPDSSETVSAQRRPNYALVAVCIILAAACAALTIQLLRSGSPATGQAQVQHAAVQAENLDWFWHPFLPPSPPPLIVIPNHPLLRAAHGGDSAQTIANGHEIAKDSLPEFRDTIHFHELKRFLFVPSTTDFTSVGETIGLVEMCQMFFRVGDPCEVRQSRLLDFEQIKNNNVILLGGNQSWSGRVFVDNEGFRFQDGVINNRNPQPGEKAIYKPEFDPVTNALTRDYALVLMLPNEKKANRILLIYGIYTQGSQAAIEFLTNPERMSKLHSALAAVSADRKAIPPYFQVLLTTTVENAVPGETSIVAVRAIQP
jgi:hypothetical protein